VLAGDAAIDGGDPLPATDLLCRQCRRRARD
jgi:hypothetical protein